MLQLLFLPEQIIMKYLGPSKLGLFPGVGVGRDGGAAMG
jgi:hypothetical protein